MATDISKLSKEYEKEKTLLERLDSPGGLKDKIAQMEEAIAIAVRDYKVKEAEKELAESKGDKATVDKLTKDLNALREDVFKKRDQLKKAKAFLDKQKGKVNAKLEELAQDPETKKKLATILYTKYDRKQKLAMNKVELLKKIKEIVDAHPTVQTWLKGIEGYEKAINKANKIIEKLGAKDPADLTLEEQTELAKAQSDLPQLQAKLAARRSDLVDYFKTKHPEIEEFRKNNNIKDDLIAGLHSYDNITRQIRGEERSIQNYEIAKSGLSVSRTATSHNPRRTSNLPAPTTGDKPSWRHPIKRIQYMYNERKNRTAPTTPTTPTSRRDVVKKVHFGKEDYNSAIVQAYLKDKEQQQLHAAATRTRKNDGR